MIGILAAVFMGFTLGLLGGGGGILTVPILTLIYAMPATQATGASLLIVGATSLVGAVREGIRKALNYRIGLEMAIPSMAGAFAARAWLLPAVPKTILFAGWEISRDRLLMALFALLMFVVAWRMFAKPVKAEGDEKKPFPIWLIGLGIGVLSGFLGAGGGFLIVPALVLVARMDTKAAAATSLFVIAIQSLVGFLGELGKPIEFGPIQEVLIGSLVGMFIGLAVRARVDEKKLRPAFAILIIAAGLLTLAKALL